MTDFRRLLSESLPSLPPGELRERVAAALANGPSPRALTAQQRERILRKTETTACGCCSVYGRDAGILLDALVRLDADAQEGE